MPKRTRDIAKSCIAMPPELHATNGSPPFHTTQCRRDGGNNAFKGFHVDGSFDSAAGSLSVTSNRNLRFGFSSASRELLHDVLPAAGIQTLSCVS